MSRRTETTEGSPLYDSLAKTFATPYTFVPLHNIVVETGAKMKQITHTLSQLRRDGKDIESVMHVGGWSRVPEGADTQFDLTNFRTWPVEMGTFLNGQREAFHHLWPHMQKVERIKYKWRDQTIRVLRPLVPTYIYETLCTMMSVLKEEGRGLMWQDIYPSYISDEHGRRNLSVSASILNKFCQSRSIPFRLASENGRTEYLFVRQ